MENKKRKWRLNLFDIIFIACVIIAALVVLRLRGGTGGGGLIGSGTQQTVVYTIALERMLGDTAFMISPGDELMDRVENRLMGRVVSVEVMPATTHQINYETGNRDLVEMPGANQAIVIVTATASVTDNQISIGGFIVRAGVQVSVAGPLYSGSGFIIDIERSDAA